MPSARLTERWLPGGIVALKPGEVLPDFAILMLKGRKRAEPSSRRYMARYRKSLKGANTSFLSRTKNCFPSSVSSISAS